MKPLKSVFAREILDSRGNPTIEVEVSDGQHVARACVPSGASTGAHEALELRDKDLDRYNGKGVLQAIRNVNTIIGPSVLGLDPQNQEAIDQKMIHLDGTPNKSQLGANAILGVSLAVCRLASVQKNIPLYRHINHLFGGRMSIPRPMMNILNGGAHADSGLAIQEFMVFPHFEDFRQNLQAGAEIFHTLKKILKSKGHAVGVGDEGGFAPHIAHSHEACDVILEAIHVTGYDGKVRLAMDAAANEFYENGQYHIDNRVVSSAELIDVYADLMKKYPIESLEDSHHEDDFIGFGKMQERFGSKLQLVGDDLLVTNPKRLQVAIDTHLCNAILIKVNQIGSLTETFQTMHLAKKHGFGTVISHRSGETEDSFIADLAVGTNAGQIKTGSLSRSERVCKYNQLLRIQEGL